MQNRKGNPALYKNNEVSIDALTCKMNGSVEVTVFSDILKLI